MREDFLHFIWKYKKIYSEQLLTTQNELVEVVATGIHNHLAGPDFFNAQIKVNHQLWAGNVEIHSKSSDWYAHGHETDVNYDNVILHVVWEDDVAIYRKDHTQIPTLELKNYIAPKVLEAYQKLFNKTENSFINCEKQLSSVDPFLLKNWLDRVFFERLEQKSIVVAELLSTYDNDWEQVLFSLLLKNFGSKVNGDSFWSLSQNIPFSKIRKISSHLEQLEAIFFGMVGFLDADDITDVYYRNLQTEYRYLQHKFQLKNEAVQKPHFFKLRPPNFPTIRLSQLAKLYHKHQNLFSKVLAADTLEDIYSLFNVKASDYWDTHFTFGKESKKSVKKTSKKFIDLLVINTLLPLKFYHAKSLHNAEDITLLKLISQMTKEENNILKNYESLGVNISNAMESQAILQLYHRYCSKNNCLQCAVGNHLLSGNT